MMAKKKSDIDRATDLLARACRAVGLLDVVSASFVVDQLICKFDLKETANCQIWRKPAKGNG